MKTDTSTTTVSAAASFESRHGAPDRGDHSNHGDTGTVTVADEDQMRYDERASRLALQQRRERNDALRAAGRHVPTSQEDRAAATIGFHLIQMDVEVVGDGLFAVMPRNARSAPSIYVVSRHLRQCYGARLTVAQHRGRNAILATLTPELLDRLAPKDPFLTTGASAPPF